MSSLSKLLRAAVMLALVFGPRLAEAQKALVYCPVSIDATGCATIKTALTSAYPGGIDTGYDGTQGTVDLTTVDLFQYSVIVVPSLADDSTSPYGLLRDATIASKLKAALLGRRAFWSGTPDQGVVSTTRPQKDALIQNLAAWAGSDFATVNAPGLVVLQDNSTDVTKRYDWVQAITGFALVADTRLASYSAVSSLTAAGNAVLSSNGSTLAYANMASMGFQTPSGAPGTSMDVVGKTGTGVGGQVVMITQTGANTGGAVVTTDKDDYAPGTPVVITGSGFGAGETVTLLLHEDPTIEPDFSFTATADQNGGFVFSGFTPDTLDVDVRFVLTATGQTSGRQAQTTFTDGIQNAGPLAFFTVTGGSTCTSTSAATSLAGTPLCAKVTINTNNGNTAGNTAQFLWFRQGQSTAAFTTSTGTIPASAAFVATSIQTPDVAGTWTVKLCLQTSLCAGAPGNTLSSNTISISSATTATSLTLSAPSPASVSFGSSGPVSISATLTATTGGAPVSGGSVAFTVDGGSIGSATTNASGVATISYSPSALGVGAHTIVASFAQATLGGTTYLQSTSGNQSLSVGQASQTISFGALPPKTFGAAPFTVSATASSGLTVTFSVGAADNCTIAGSTVTITGAGSCTVTANQAGNANYAAAAPVQQPFTIAQATATLTIDPASLTATYDGSPHAAIVTTTPAGLTVVAVTYAGSASAPTNAASYPVVAKLTNANYIASDATGTLNIARAAPIFSNVSTPAVTYPASTATISGTVKAGSLPATGTVGITVSGTGGPYLGSVAVDGSGNFSTAVSIAGLPANATGYDVALVLPQSTNFEQASDNTHKLVVNQAAQSITFAALGGKTFGDAPFTVSATSSSGLTVTFSASGNCSVAGSTVTITGAGSCTVTADQAGDGNYQAAPSVPQSFTIGKATATISVSGFSGAYDGAAHGATGTATGVAGANLNASLDLGQSFTNVPGGTANWTFTDVTGNYNNASGTAAIVITKADATIDVDGYTGVYDGNAHGATGTAKGVGGVALAGLDLGASFTNVPGGTANWVFTDVTGNYNDANGNAAIVISKADATIAVNGYTGVYDAAAHGATGTAKGIGGVALAGLDLGASFTNVPGGTANWVFTDVTGNYNDANGNAAIVISKADATIAVNGYTGVYDAAAHGATGTAKGIGGVALAGLNLGASFTNVPGGTADWTFTDVTGNYNDASGSAVIVISKADATIAVNGYTGIYDGAAHGASGTAKGVGGVSLAGLNLGASFTNVPGGTASWTFTDGTGNYNNASGTAAITISKATIAAPILSNLVQPYNGTQRRPTVAISPAGVQVTLSFADDGAPVGSNAGVVPVGVYNVLATITDQNYTGPTADALFVIYDASAGFVTGGGWIMSGPNSYVADPSLTGKANFGFVSKYQKGANVPSGNTEFQFKEGNLNFSSTNFQWLVIQGTTMSQFKGTGTINGQGNYNFLVTAIDGDQFTGAKKPDSFRIKITNGSNVVYDNQIGQDDTSNAATTLGGGSIQIQAK